MIVDLRIATQEALAASAIGSKKSNDPPTFRADQPLAFPIGHRLSGAILFLGRVTDPIR
jgi:serine protease inhibitor